MESLDYSKRLGRAAPHAAHYNCPVASILRWKPGNDGWQHDQAGPIQFQDIDGILAGSPVCAIFASANKVRTCPLCQSSFVKAFHMPEAWWSDYCQNSNGYVGSQVTTDQGVATGFNIWAYFEMKQLDERMNYQWHKINIFIRWLTSTRQIVVLFLDIKPPMIERIKTLLLNPDPSWLDDPFWVYARLADEIVRLEDSAVWAIRDHVRGIEKEERPEGIRPQPHYRRLHDIARHAIHVSESLDVTAETMEGIITQHEDFTGQHFSADEINLDASRNIRRQLHFYKSMISSLRYRSASNKDRLQNEIQLAFNIAAQYDTAISVQIGRAAQADSSAMKTIAFFTMAFLPATFLASIFSMSFFDYDAAADSWTVSNKFWIYWVFTIPITLGAFSLWYFWHRIFSSPPME
ncbi:hypothetical protein F4677DRAFT_438237 [Hypoxylon crocopeplum]|nr:hypothetical protein F4677DRAFT_438237 [Hypoxylon crocopeplum]